MPLPNEVDILLIEDNPHDAELIQHALGARGLYKTMFRVQDGVEALEFLLGQKPNKDGQLPGWPRLILLDLKLPRVNGIEVLQQLKSHALTRNIPVVVLTSSREDRDILRCYELGVNSYVVKPVDFDAFTEAVGQIGTYWLNLNQQPDWAGPKAG